MSGIEKNQLPLWLDTGMKNTQQLCHVNLLKLYYRSVAVGELKTMGGRPVLTVTSESLTQLEDGLPEPDDSLLWAI